MTNKLALIVALVLGVLSILGIKLYVDKIKADVERAQQYAEVLVAARDVRPGETLDAKDIDKMKLPRSVVDALKKTNLENPDAIVGAKVMHEVRQGQVLQSYHFSAKGRGRVPLQIGGPEWRAVTIPVSGVTGVAGLVRPGDFVDVVAVLQVKFEGAGAQAGARQTNVVRTLAKKVLVLATDAYTDPHAESPLVDYATVTLRLRTSDANKVILTIGTQQHIQLSKVEDTATEAPTWDAMTPDKLYREVEDELKK